MGGNITIDPQFILLQNSQIVANAFEGHGGNIRLVAQQVFLADPSSTVSASSALGINGQVAVQAPVTSISGTVAPLPQSFARATELLRDRCAERVRGGTLSRFVLGGRDGVPAEPGALLLSPLVQGSQKETARYGRQEGETRPEPRGATGLAPLGQLQGGYVQAGVPSTPEVECARWRGRPGSRTSGRR